MRAIAETGFDAIYLIAVINIGILMIRRCEGNQQYRLFPHVFTVLSAVSMVQFMDTGKSLYSGTP